MQDLLGSSATGNCQRNDKVCMAGKKKREGENQKSKWTQKAKYLQVEDRVTRKTLCFPLFEKIQCVILMCKPSCDFNTNFSTTSGAWRSRPFPLESPCWHPLRERTLWFDSQQVTHISCPAGRRSGVPPQMALHLIHFVCSKRSSHHALEATAL